jgi:anaerobic magnesium-protoporphyrin IX monomethyl ester cyclase
MSKILFISTNKWGRGVTTIWIPSHAGLLKNKNHICELFDCTFFSEWTSNENIYNTVNKQYQPTDYDGTIIWNDNNIFTELQEKINTYKPDIIFSSALSSHIHGEGEYSSIQYFHELISKIKTDAIIVAGGLQVTADIYATAKRFPNFNFLIAGESELVLESIALKIDQASEIKDIPGLVKIKKGKVLNDLVKQPILNELDILGEYDYSLFDEQIFQRPYNGDVYKAVDYEMSRGCIYTCAYCVETTIQSYYGFTETSKSGALLKPKRFLRAKSPERIFSEIKDLYENFGVRLFRCQDTNFLTIPSSVLKSIAQMIDSSGMDIKLYIETRPEGINEKSIELLKLLKVDGVGMGVEAAEEDYREISLNRFANQTRIIRAFDLLREANIGATAYNVIGFPNQGEESIINTIKLNIQLNPSNITVAFYSPFIGTNLQRSSADDGLFDRYAYDIDSQLRSLSAEGEEKVDMLGFYKRNFVKLVRDGLDKLPSLKEEYFG